MPLSDACPRTKKCLILLVELNGIEASTGRDERRLFPGCQLPSRGQRLNHLAIHLKLAPNRLDSLAALLPRDDLSHQIPP